ncbi:MAG: 50S ribosomal protein L9 [bacterium]|nr:50S ribosomal protein L9 [bacterium]
MKVILLKDVKKVGKKFEVKDVADGFALNFLIPRKFAEVSNDSNTRKVETLKVRDTAEKKIQEDLLMKNLKGLEGITLELKENANGKGHLFKGVHKEEIVAGLKTQGHLDIPSDYIVLEKPIKEVGEHTIEVKVQDKSANFKLVISAQ